jgi:hypothetical protein
MTCSISVVTADDAADKGTVSSFSTFYDRLSNSCAKLKNTTNLILKTRYIIAAATSLKFVFCQKVALL